MSEIVVTREQAAVIAHSRSGVKLKDPDGKLIGYAAPSFTAEEIAAAERSALSSEPCYTTEEVLQYLQGLEKK